MQFLNSKHRTAAVAGEWEEEKDKNEQIARERRRGRQRMVYGRLSVGEKGKNNNASLFHVMIAAADCDAAA